VTVTACPPEVWADIAPVPVVPDTAEIRANATGHDWVTALIVWAGGLYDRTVDARAACLGQVGEVAGG